MPLRFVHLAQFDHLAQVDSLEQLDHLAQSGHLVHLPMYLVWSDNLQMTA